MTASAIIQPAPAPEANASGGGTGLVEMPSGILVPEAFACEMVLAQRRITCVDVFAGAGGFSLGVIRAGMEVVCAIEYDPTCVLTYMANLCRYGQVQVHCITPRDEARMNQAIEREWKRQSKERKNQLELTLAGCGWISSQPDHVPGVSHIIVGDVRELTGRQLLEWIGLKRGELGCMVGGPPCQGFSYAGRRDPNDRRSPLVFEFARLIVETNPQTCVMENVPGIASMHTAEGVRVVDRFCQILRDGGFHGVEAFEQLKKRPTAVGAMRGNPRPKRRPKAERAVEDEDEE